MIPIKFLKLRNLSNSYIVETSNNSNGFYRKYSDGYIEQYGFVSVPVDGSRAITYPVKFTNLSSIMIQCTVNKTVIDDHSDCALSASSVTVTGCTIYNGGNKTHTIAWFACGY